MKTGCCWFRWHPSPVIQKITFTVIIFGPPLVPKPKYIRKGWRCKIQSFGKSGAVSLVQKYSGDHSNKINNIRKGLRLPIPCMHPCGLRFVT